jgi:hypothetical protein
MLAECVLQKANAYSAQLSVFNKFANICSCGPIWFLRARTKFSNFLPVKAGKSGLGLEVCLSSCAFKIPDLGSRVPYLELHVYQEEETVFSTGSAEQN